MKCIIYIQHFILFLVVDVRKSADIPPLHIFNQPVSMCLGK